MLRCRVVAREVLLERAPVDQVGAGARPQRHARDRRLALARRAVARAGGEIDRGGRDRLARAPPRLLLLAWLGASSSTSVRVDRVGVLVAPRRGPAGRRPRGRCRPRGARPGTAGFSRGAGSSSSSSSRGSPASAACGAGCLGCGAAPRAAAGSAAGGSSAAAAPRLRRAPRRPARLAGASVSAAGCSAPAPRRSCSGVSRSSAIRPRSPAVAVSGRRAGARARRRS